MKQDELPNFVGIGAQKSGTTTLYKMLKAHPEIYLPECKEVHYFDNNYTKGISWYKKHFSNRGHSKIFGEITPHYLFHKEAANRIHREIPQTKIIMLLRDPVERTLSHYFHARQRNFEMLELQDALCAESRRMKSNKPFIIQRHSYISRSKYIEQIDRYENKFHKNQMMIIKSEEYFSNTDSIKELIYSFLGVKNIMIKGELTIANKSTIQKKAVSNTIRRQLEETFKETYAELKKRYGIEWNDMDI